MLNNFYENSKDLRLSRIESGVSKELGTAHVGHVFTDRNTGREHHHIVMWTPVIKDPKDRANS